jgi:hypothetical protein
MKAGQWLFLEECNAVDVDVEAGRPHSAPIPVLTRPYHLYAHLFAWDSALFMVPEVSESADSLSIRLGVMKHPSFDRSGPMTRPFTAAMDCRDELLLLHVSAPTWPWTARSANPTHIRANCRPRRRASHTLNRGEGIRAVDGLRRILPGPFSAQP